MWKGWKSPCAMPGKLPGSQTPVPGRLWERKMLGFFGELVKTCFDLIWFLSTPRKLLFFSEKSNSAQFTPTQ